MERVHRAVVAYASVGSGHRVAAEAVCDAATRRGLTCEPVDILAHGRVRISGDLMAFTFTGPTAPLYDRTWHGDARPGGIPGSSAALALGYGPLRSLLLENRPETLVCTHAMAAIVADRWRSRDDLDLALVAVLTDFEAHSQWPLGLDAYCVPSQRAHDTLVARGVPGERVAITGIPLRRHFDEPTMVRGDERGPYLLIIAGARKQRVYRNLAAALPELTRRLSAAGVRTTIVTGENEGLRARLAPLAGDDIELLGYVDDIPELMGRASLFVGKPGGLVCAEALATALPMVFVGPVFGQERANVAALEEAGVALHTAEPAEAAETVVSLLQDPTQLAAMATAATTLHRPHAAEAVVDVVSSAIGPR